ncbi:MAG TPA: ABC transporter permease [Puia sp.]|nr:ABC transporter permease [Puia sp.]
MLKNLLLIALRNFKRDKWYSLLNILGLTIGITFSLFLIFYVLDELSYDRYHVNSDRIYRINGFAKEPEKEEMKWAVTQIPLGPTLQRDFPEVEQATRFMPGGKQLFKIGDNQLYVDKVFLTDSNVFKIFSWPFIEGDPRTALVAPHSIVLTRSVADRIFGKDVRALGRSIMSDTVNYKVTGVVPDVPKNSHLLFNALISITSLPPQMLSQTGNWGGFGLFTYVLLKPNARPETLQAKLKPLYDKYMAPIFAQYNIKIRYEVVPITSIHLHTKTENEPEQQGSMSYIYIFSAVALFMLIIASINYMNLTTARSARRAKEIGIRKVTGSTKGQLIAQFLIESILTTVLALILSMILIALLLPTFNLLSGKTFSFRTLLQPDTYLILLALIVFVGFAGGSYPAFYLSRFNPVDVLKGSLSTAGGNVTLRRLLVLVQFSISMIMLICTLIVYGQLKYLRNIDLGFSKEQVLTIRPNTRQNLGSKVQAFENEVKMIPQVMYVSSSQAVPGDNVGFNLLSMPSDKGYVQKGVFNYAVDEHFLPTMGIQIVKGRNFSGTEDSTRVLVNDNMVRYYKWDQPIGKRVKYPGDTSAFYMEVIGVVKDFNQRSLYDSIAPLILFYQHYSNMISVKLRPEDIPATLANVESKWKTIFPGIPFEYTFLDRDFDSQFAADQRRGKIFTAFSGLTILITCLGLLGLIAFTTEQRRKEISIRKVLGAGVGTLVPLVTGNFVLLVGLSCLIAFPVAWFFMDKWLNVFPYRIGMPVAPFVLSAVAVLVITMMTVTFHTLKAAVANPSKSLRTE